MIETVETDVLILGAGGAGLCAALHAADASPTLRITVVVKGLLGRAGCTRMVQGGGWINDQELVWTLVREAPSRVLELESRYGCFFDRTAEGRIHQKPFAGQSHDRTIHKGDLTGIEIMNRLAEQVAHRPNVRALEECRAVELLLDDTGGAAGALVLDVRTGESLAVTARATLLAMGGGPTMYKTIACSSDKAADGIALAYLAGLPLRDMEMIQFHPTGLVVPGSLMTGALLEEGLRGAEGRGTPNGGVWIDVSHLGAEIVERNFRGMVKRCRDFGRDLAREPVEVGPTAHFMMGGVVIDPACRTAIDGLFCAGEDSGGVHGANRLGGNGVAESTVFGGIAGDAMAAFVKGRATPRVSRSALEASVRWTTAPLGRAADGARQLYDLQRDLGAVMWDRAGLVRDARGLGEALVQIDRIAAALEGIAVPGGRAFNLAWQDWLNLENQVTVARLIVASASARRESRGAHYRSDFPLPEAEPRYTVRVQRSAAGLAVRREPVALTRATPEGSAAAPALIEIGD